MRLYSGCGTRRVTSTTMVFCILVETTARPFRSCCRSHAGLLLVGHGLLPLLFLRQRRRGRSGCSSRSRSTVSMRARSLRMRAASSSRRSGPWPSGNAAGTSARAFRCICACQLVVVEFPNFFAFIRLIDLLLTRRPRAQPTWSAAAASARPAASPPRRCRLGTPSISNRILPGRITAHPLLRRALAFTHTGFSRLLGDRLVRKQADPNLAAALDETRHGDAGRFNLPVGDPAAVAWPSARSRRTRAWSRARPCRSCARAAVSCT